MLILSAGQQPIVLVRSHIHGTVNLRSCGRSANTQASYVTRDLAKYGGGTAKIALGLLELTVPRGGPHQFPPPLSERSAPPYAGESFGVCTSSSSTPSMAFTLISGARHSLLPTLTGRDL
jgi:hypothetical protein